MQINGIDEIDNQIVNLLRENARLSYSEIGEKVGLTRVAVKNRVKSLEEKGIIKGYHAEIDPLATPEMLPFIAEITTDAPSFTDIAEKLKEDSRVVTLCEITSGCTLHAVCVAKSMSDMKWFLQHFRDKNPGVLRCYVYNVLEVMKGSVLPNYKEHANERNCICTL